MRGRTLIVAADWMDAASLYRTLEATGFPVAGIAMTARDAVILAHEHRPDVAVSALWLPDGDGVVAACRYAPEVGCIPLFLSAHPRMLRPLRPPPCLCIADSASTDQRLLVAVAAALHWHRFGHPPDILPHGVASLEAPA